MTGPACSACGGPFADRGELLVLSVGRAMVPVHPRCRRTYAGGLPWFLRGAGVVNRSSAFLWLVGFNLMFGGWWALARPEHRGGVLFAWVLSNLFLLAQRFTAWWSYERHVPPAP